jgi:ribonuclease R
MSGDRDIREAEIRNFVSPLDEKFLYEISIAPSDTLGANDGEIANVEITRPPIAGRPPWGRVIEVLGRPDQPGIDVEIIIRKHRLTHVFPETALAEAEAIPDSVTEEQLAGERIFAVR